MEATVTCPNGHVNPVGAEFCAECGQSLVVDKTSVWSVSELSSQFQEQASGGGTEAASGDAEEDEPAPAARAEPEPETAGPVEEEVAEDAETTEVVLMELRSIRQRLETLEARVQRLGRTSS